MEEKAKQPRIVVGVVGATGAGKSSVINAVLDEERLVPTSGMRACTATVTEISYNHSDDPSELYRAEVEFVSPEEWSRELISLLDDLIDSDGKLSGECNDPDTDAGLAYSKIKAVYPSMTKEQIVRCPGDLLAMAQEPLVYEVLGRVKRLRATSSADLYNGLQQYIDSKSKTSSQMEYWPLVKVVRIYCKAPALSTGVVLVDLPGKHLPDLIPIVIKKHERRKRRGEKQKKNGRWAGCLPSVVQGSMLLVSLHLWKYITVAWHTPPHTYT